MSGGGIGVDVGFGIDVGVHIGVRIGIDLHLHEPELPGDDPRIAGPALPSVPHCDLEMEQRPDRLAVAGLVALVHQHRAFREHAAVAFEDEVDGRVEQGVAGREADRRRRASARAGTRTGAGAGIRAGVRAGVGVGASAVTRDLRLLEADPLVALQHRPGAAGARLARPDRAGGPG